MSSPVLSAHNLPIDAVLPAILGAMQVGGRAVLVAPPGAGKTTRVPLALLDQPWTQSGRLIVLEPRRLAARAAAERMASMLCERVGETIGLRARFDTRISARTRIEVVTEGVFTRMILDDPGLDGIAGVLFDEFHERSLDADLGLALALEAKGVLRGDLRVLVMSATLDGARVAAILDDAPVIESQGRAFPVDTRYLGRDPGRRLEEDVAAAIRLAHRTEPGSILAFLPGQAEITRAATLLGGSVGAETDIAPLYGAMDRAAQDRAVSPSPAGRRKIVLATSVAETSLTIEGVRVVVDSGMARVPRFEPDLGLTRLETVRVSRASADQRRGRAGRTAPGVCYRLWEEAGTGGLQPFGRPEILDADLSGLLLDLAAWGTRNPAELRWLDLPPAPTVEAARTLLRDLGALDHEGAITERGRAIARLALPPRLARMVIVAAEHGAAELGGKLATILVERGLGGTAVDLADRLERWDRDRSPRSEAARGLARSLGRTAERSVREPGQAREPPGLGFLLAQAFPERIAKARGKAGVFLLANGRAASVEPHDRLAGADYLAVGEIIGRAAASRIVAAAPMQWDEVEAAAGPALRSSQALVFDAKRGRLGHKKTLRLGAIKIEEQNLAVLPSEDAAQAFAKGIAGLGLDRLPWSRPLAQWRERVVFLYGAEGSPWPDLSDACLTTSVGTWLAPFLLGKTDLSDVSAGDMVQALQALLPHELARRLEREAPSYFEAPTGSQIAVAYDDASGPSIAVRVQELYGLNSHPTIANGHVPLTLHLLSPARRPIQITRDLPAFWSGSWLEVRAEMRGRYPRHLWPDDPALATATARAKLRGT